MPNINKPGGLAPVQYMNGSPWNGQARTYYIPQADTNAYAIGDPVSLAGDGDLNGVPSVALTAAGANPLCGAVVGVGRYETLMADPSNLDTIVIPSVKLHPYYVMVADDPAILFELQEGGAAAALTSANIGQNANLLAGANTGYLSGWQFNNASVAVTATLQVRLFGLVRRSDNAFGAYAKWLVKINNHQLAPNTAGI